MNNRKQYHNMSEFFELSQEEIDELMRSEEGWCYHLWEEYTGFTTIDKKCCYCGKIEHILPQRD